MVRTISTNREPDMRRIVLLAVLAATTAVLGCAKETDPNRPATYPVTGTVTLNGEPVEGATVVFQKTDRSHGAVGETGPGGSYSLTSFEANDGAVPGEYLVSIYKYPKEEVTGTEATSVEDYVQPDDNQAGAVPVNLLPAQYARPETSELKATVTEAENKHDFDLKGEAPKP